MGNVPILTTLGDNDPEIAGGSYYRHYLYCDSCGSFELDPWRTPPHEQAIERTRRRLGTAAALGFPLVTAGAWFTRALGSPGLVLGAGLAVVAGLLVVRGVLGSKIAFVGLRCRRCGATYRHGSPLFTDRDANPRQLTAADVPRPWGSSPYFRGESVADEPGSLPEGLDS